MAEQIFQGLKHTVKTHLWLRPKAALIVPFGIWVPPRCSLKQQGVMLLYLKLTPLSHLLAPFPLFQAFLGPLCT